MRFPLAVRHARLASCAGGVLVGADHPAVHIVHQPVQLAEAVGAAGDLGQQPVEHALTTPAIEAAGDRPLSTGKAQILTTEAQRAMLSHQEYSGRRALCNAWEEGDDLAGGPS
jgi:hypothetical protein